MVTGKKKKKTTSDHQSWELIFKALEQILQKQAQKIDSLLQERKLLQDRILLQRQRWSFDNHLLVDAISLLRRQLSTSELEKSCAIAKADFRLSSKHRNSVVDKLKLEHVQCDLDDLKAWFDILSHRCPDKEISSPNMVSEILKEKGGNHTSTYRSQHQSKLEKEVTLLKHEYQKLSVQHKSDMSALQDKYNFVWNQYKEMEANYTNQLQTKNDEINRANEKILNLMTNIEQLQSASIEMEETVRTLRAYTSDMKVELNKKDGELFRLLKELEVIIGSSNEPSTSRSKGKNIRDKSESPALEEASVNAQLQATISTLRDKLSELQTEADQRSEEISTLSKELQLLRSESSSDMPVLIRCTSEPYTSRLRSRINGRVGGDRGNTEQLKSSSTEMGETVKTLRANIASLIAKANRKDDQICKLLKELKLIKAEKIGVSNEPSTPGLKGKTNGGKRQSPALQEGANNTQLQATISTLRTKLSELQTESDHKSEEISTLSNELKLLRSESCTDMPVLRSCTNKPSSPGSRERVNGRGGQTEDQISFAQLQATIASLQVKIGELEAERSQKYGEISALSRDLKTPSEGAGGTPLKHYTTRASSSRLRRNRNGAEQDGAALREKASSAGLVSEQGGRQSKRKQDMISNEDTPRLFTSQFKIPKLRSPSPLERR